MKFLRGLRERLLAVLDSAKDEDGWESEEGAEALRALLDEHRGAPTTIFRAIGRAPVARPPRHAADEEAEEKDYTPRRDGSQEPVPPTHALPVGWVETGRAYPLRTWRESIEQQPWGFLLKWQNPASRGTDS